MAKKIITLFSRDPDKQVGDMMQVGTPKGVVVGKVVRRLAGTMGKPVKLVGGKLLDLGSKYYDVEIPDD